MSDALAEAYGISVRSLVAVITTMVAQTAALEGEVERCFGRHPDAEIITSQPGLGVGTADIERWARQSGRIA